MFCINIDFFLYGLILFSFVFNHFPHDDLIL
nr:MAG TPA: hypothetical protein [Bacteriophage sp.]